MSDRVSKKARVANPAGIHLRAAGEMVRAAEKFKSRITVVFEGVEANVKSIISIMSLAAGPGAVLMFKAWGPDAEEAVVVLARLVEGNQPEKTS